LCHHRPLCWPQAVREWVEHDAERARRVKRIVLAVFQPEDEARHAAGGAVVLAPPPLSVLYEARMTYTGACENDGAARG
jgi:hypothetical protein